MSTYGLSAERTDWWAEAREAMREALRHPGVAAVAIIFGGLVALAVVGGLIWLALAQADSSSVLSLVSLLLNAFVLKRLSDVDARTKTVEAQTNGHTKRLMDAALKDKE